MRVGVELMITNISVAKSSLRPSKMTQGTKMVLAAFDARDELGDIILGSDFLGLDLFAFIVKAADEADLGEQVFRRIRYKIKHRVFLPNLCREHICAFRSVGLRSGTPSLLNN